MSHSLVIHSGTTVKLMYSPSTIEKSHWVPRKGKWPLVRQAINIKWQMQTASLPRLHFFHQPALCVGGIQRDTALSSFPISTTQSFLFYPEPVFFSLLKLYFQKHKSTRNQTTGDLLKA